MKKIYLIFLGLLLCTDGFSANVRSSNANIRQDAPNVTVRKTTNRTKTNSINRSAVSRTPVAQQNIVSSRSAVKTVSPRYSETQKNILSRTTTTNRHISRATTNTSVSTNTFGNSYTTCRDAYFTCMDQFCATQNDTYRRCVCSSRLEKIQKQESLLSQTSASLQDFKDFNIDAISKTSAEVIAMQNAAEGEQAIKEDKSISMQNLKNIKDVLNTTKNKYLSTQGTLDIAGDIKSIWKTTDLIRGYDIATLSGEALYNAVNAQCKQLVANQCAMSDLKMIASAYGMYIENDCELLANRIKTNTVNANAAIRQTRHEMQDARYENYNVHNSLSLNDCVARVKQDITADTACGTNYIHCLDVTGKYLNIDTGEPIYSPEFYQFENQIVLSDNVLKEGKNTAFINLLNKKQKYAQQTLDSCRDVADDVWDEFLHQAIIEMYQAQAERVQIVKTECLQVVSQCYIDQSDILKQYSHDVSMVTTQQTLELSEELCKEKLNSCSNLYGGGTNGFKLLVSTLANIVDAEIAQDCPDMLQKYVESRCAVPYADSTHSYPYGCRTFAPGSMNDSDTDTLYGMLKQYAKDNCARTEYAENDLSNILLEDINKIMTDIRTSMTKELSATCETYDNYTWSTIPCTKNPEYQNEEFYEYTATNDAWGCCIRVNTSTDDDDDGD